MKQKIKVWDLPTRLFHWTLVLAFAFMWYSADKGGTMLAWHLRCGLLILALLVFRVCWGFWGSDTARFGSFVRGPSHIKRYLQGKIGENEQPGHNPLGALMVLALLAAVSVQVATGLFAADADTFSYSGYLNGRVSEETGNALRKIHLRFFNLLALLAAVHVVSILFYKFLKKHDLIKPMITGYKELEGRLPVLHFAGFGKLAAAAAAALLAVACVLAAAG